MVNTDNWKLKNIFEDKNPNVFKIPIYQRGYDWESKHVEAFFDDLVEADTTSGGSTGTHFFGLIYTEPIADDERPNTNRRNWYRVIDGQQRLTTAALFFLCARDIAYEYSEESEQISFYCDDCHVGLPYGIQDRINRDLLDRDAQLHISDIEKMLFRWNRDSSPAAPDLDKCILGLSRVNNEFFVNNLIQKQKPKEKIQKMKSVGKNSSEEKLASSYEFIYKKFMEIKDNYPITNNDGTKTSFFIKLGSLVDSLTTLFDVIHISVEDEEEAYEMFNLVNNRGLPLQNADLIKHIIFSELFKEYRTLQDRDEQLTSYDQTWAEIIDTITGEDNSNYPIENFIHHYLVTFKENETKVKQVFQTIKQMLQRSTNPEKPSTLINHMKVWSDHFNTLRNPYGGPFDEVPRVQFYLQKIRDRTESTSLWPVVLAGYEKFWQTGQMPKKKEFGAILQLCFRYFVRSKSMGPITGTRIDTKMKRITKGIMEESWSSQKIKDELIIADPKSYQTKAEFEQYFVNTYTIRDTTNAQYLLEELENLLDPDYFKSDRKITIEHIMPKSISKWRDDIIKNEGYTGTDKEKKELVRAFQKKYLYKLGNLTLLKGEKNTKAGNKKFEDKLPVYKDDGYHITAEIESTWTKWNEVNILDRHNRLCEKLKGLFDIASITI